jgi:hypothetical protein
MKTVADQGAMTALVAAQVAGSRLPYQKMVFTDKAASTATVELSTDSAAFPNRILSLDHNEEAWNDYAIVVLNDPARDIPDLRGYWTEIGYGLTIAGSAAYSSTPRLWVKHQQTVWARDRYTTILELEGMWARLGEMVICNTAANTAGTFDPSGTVLYAAGSTVYGNLSSLMTNWGFTMAGTSAAEDDGVINASTMDFYVNMSPQETALQITRGLMSMTYDYLLAQTGLTFKAVNPANTAVDFTYNHNASPQYYDFVERKNTIIPNKSYVFANQDEDGNYTILASTTDTTGTTQYLTTSIYIRAPSVASSTQAITRAQIYVNKMHEQGVSGRVTVPHDSQIELWDRVEIK